MKVLQALFFPPEQPGGVSSMVPYIKEAFTKQGWNMDLFSLPKRIRNKGKKEVRFATFDWKPFSGNRVVDKYIQTYRDYLWWSELRLHEQYDIIHTHHPIAALAMKQRFPDIPVLTTIHSSFERELILNGEIKEHGPEHRFLLSLYRELEYQTDGLLTVSDAFKQYLAQFVEDGNQIKVIPNGFDQNRFRPVSHHNPVPQLISVCRLVKAKGLDVLLQACGQLKKRGHNFVLHIIGDGPIREDLEQLARELGIYEETIFYGYMLHPEEFMPFSDIFVLPSRAEAFGSVFAEAALSWLCLIGTDVGGIAEQIEHQVNGMLVPVDDVNALVDTLERVLLDQDLRHRLARNAYEKATQIYSLERVIESLNDVYQNVAMLQTKAT